MKKAILTLAIVFALVSCLAVPSTSNYDSSANEDISNFSIRNVENSVIYQWSVYLSTGRRVHSLAISDDNTPILYTVRRSNSTDYIIENNNPVVDEIVILDNRVASITVDGETFRLNDFEYDNLIRRAQFLETVSFPPRDTSIEKYIEWGNGFFTIRLMDSTFYELEDVPFEIDASFVKIFYTNHSDYIRYLTGSERAEGTSDTTLRQLYRTQTLENYIRSRVSPLGQFFNIQGELVRYEIDILDLFQYGDTSRTIRIKVSIENIEKNITVFVETLPIRLGANIDEVIETIGFPTQRSTETHLRYNLYDLLLVNDEVYEIMQKRNYHSLLDEDSVEGRIIRSSYSH